MGTRKAKQNRIDRKKLLAVYHISQGKTYAEAARLARTSNASAYRWHAAYKKDSTAWLKRKYSPGRPAKIPGSDQERVRLFLSQILSAPRSQKNRLRLSNIANYLEREFGVRYSKSHISRMLMSAGWNWNPSVKLRGGKIKPAGWVRRS